MLQVGTVLGVLTLVYAPAIRELANVWWTRDSYSHGFLVVPISLYLAWRQRSAVEHRAWRPGNMWGAVVMGAAAVLLVVGTAGSVVVLGGWSFVIMVVGLVAYLLGGEFLIAFAFPLAYLVLMIPMFDELLAGLHWPLQVLTAATAVRLLQVLGIPALVDHQYIALPGITLEVAKACSGVNYLVSILAIGLPLAYLTLASWWNRAVLVVVGLVIGVAANSMRVFLIGIWANAGRPVLHGPFEIFQAMFVAWVGGLALIGAAWGLQARHRPAARSDEPGRTRSRTADPVSPAINPPAQWNRSWAIALVLLTVAGACLMTLHRGSTALAADFEAVPHTVGGWVGRPADPAEAVFRLHGADQELLRVYRNKEGRAVTLYVAYLAGEERGKKLVDYRTARLHEAAQPLTIRPPDGGVIAVNGGRFRGDRSTYSIIFWYQINGQPFANPYRAKLALIRSALLHGRTNGALVVIAAVPGDDQTADRQLKTFAEALIPKLRSYFL